MVLFWIATMLVASTCFGADIHYCKGEVQSFALFGKAKPCKMHKKGSSTKTSCETRQVESQTSKCCMARKELAKKSSQHHPVLKNAKCCFNDQVAFKTDSEASHSGVQIPDLSQLDLQFSVVASEPSYFRNVEQLYIARSGPPDQLQFPDFQIFYQVFLI